ncbi:unnamed protein product [Mytilus coruscus]|uniref:G-protein coupled receptors family 1 profile domain-containing protein n=1 Tax=Mytilus coruscus TaxID=42192 RepID=A0A6J8DS18_MYTCO|nr:unnamed protein product [Mytilus coruscus]
MRYNYTWSSDGACKFFKFLNHVVTGASASLLTTIAIERYKLFVKNLPRLFAILKRTNVISAVLVGFSVVSSIPASIFYGSNDKETNMFGLIGKDCSFSSEYQNMRIAGGLFCIVMSVVSYGRILHEICTRKKWRKSLRKKTVPSLNSTSDIRSETTQVISTIQNAEVKINNMQIEICKKAKKTSSRSSHNLGNAIRLTVSLMIATAVSYVGNLLYVFTLMYRMLNPKIYHTHIRPVSFILVRAYFINNAINPFVFCLMDRTFRQEFLKLYKNICSKKNI